MKPLGHVFDGGGKSGKDDRGHHENKGTEECLLHGHGQRRDQQSDAHDGDDEAPEGQNEGADGAAKGHAKPVDRTRRKQKRIHEAKDHARQGFGDEYFRGGEGCHQQLIKGAEFAFPGHRKAGENHDHYHADKAAQCRYNKPPALKIGVKPSPLHPYDLRSIHL